MHRRQYIRALAGVAGGAAVFAAGCLADDSTDGSASDGDEGPSDATGGDGNGGPDGTDGTGGTDGSDDPDGESDWLADLPSMPDAADPATVELSYPMFQPAYYPITASPARGDAEPVPFADAPPDAQLEIANAIVRSDYVTDRSATLDAELHQQPVAVGGETFSITVAVADRFQRPEHGPEGDANWSPPVTLATAARDGAFWIRLRNELDRPLPLHHYGRPYFGALVAVGDGDATVLDNERYEENRFIEPGDPVQTSRVAGNEHTTDVLRPDEAVTERYDLPSSVPAGARVWCSLPIGDESIDLLGNRRTTATGVATIE